MLTYPCTVAPAAATITGHTSYDELLQALHPAALHDAATSLCASSTCARHHLHHIPAVHEDVHPSSHYASDSAAYQHLRYVVTCWNPLSLVELHVDHFLTVLVQAGEEVPREDVIWRRVQAAYSLRALHLH